MRLRSAGRLHWDRRRDPCRGGREYSQTVRALAEASERLITSGQAGQAVPVRDHLVFLLGWSRDRKAELGGGHGHPVVVGDDPGQVGAELPGGRKLDCVKGS